MLIKEAIGLLDEFGPEAVTIRAVARRAGVSHAAPANHFEDRKHLLTEVAARIFRDFAIEAAALASSSGATSSELAKVYMRCLARLGIEHPGRFELLWRKDLIDWNDETLMGVMDEVYAKFVVNLHSSAASKNVDPDSIAVALWAAVQGYINLRTSGIFEDRYDAISGKPRLEVMLDIILGN